VGFLSWALARRAVTIRTAGKTELDTILALIERQQSVDAVTPESYRDNVADGSYRDSWTWVVEEEAGSKRSPSGGVRPTTITRSASTASTTPPTATRCQPGRR
jgi:hypothetical protein